MRKELFDEFLIDAELGIKTTGRNDKHADTHRYPYEPTAYSIIGRLIDSEFLSDKDILFDYGCGMGRVPIYLHKKVGCKAYGIEIVEDFYNIACNNAQNSNCNNEVKFVCGRAENYELPSDVTACFFFNPFDIGIMRGVMKQIIKSYDECPREISLFFYYPQDEYIAYLSTIDELEFIDEIDCSDIEAVDVRRNRIMIFNIR